MQILVTCCGSLLLLALVESGDLLNDRPTADLAKRPLEHPPPPAGLLPFVDESKDGTPEQIESFGKNLPEQVDSAAKKTFDALEKGGKSRKTTIFIPKHLVNSSSTGKLQRKVKKLRKKKRNLIVKSSVLDPVSSTLAYTRNKRKRGNRTPFGNRGQATVVAKLNALLKGDKARVAERLNGGKATVPMAKAPPLTVLPFSSQNHINEPTISHRSIGGKRRKFPIRIIPQRTTSVVDPEEKILEYTTSVTTLGVTSPGLELPEYPDDITETSTVAGTLASTSGTLETTNTVTQMATEPATTLWTTVTPVLPINNRETLAELVSIKANDGQGTQATVGTQESTGIGREGTVTTQDPFSDSIFFPEITIQPPIEISDNEPTTTTATPNTGFFGVTVNPPSDDQLAEAEKIVKIKEERRKVEEEEYYRTSTEPTSAATVVSTVLDRDAEGGIVEAQGAAQEGTVADGGIGRGLEGTVMGQEGTVATEEGTVGGQSSTTEKLEPYTGTTVEPTLYKVFGDINDDLENANFVGKFSLQEDPEELQKEIIGIVKAVQPALESNGSVVILEADVRGIDENLAPNLVVKQVNKALKKVKKLRRKKIKNAEISTGDKQGHQIPLQAGAGAGAGQVLQVPLQVSAGASPGAGQVHQALQVPLQARSTVAGQAKSLQPQPGAGQIQHLRQIPTVSGTVRSSQQLRQVPLPPAYVQQQLQPVPLPSTGAEPVRPGPHSLPRFWNYQLQQQQQPQQHWAYYQPLGQQQAQEVLAIIKELKKAQGSSKKPQSFSVFTTTKQSYFILPNGRVLVVAEESRLAKHRLDDEDKVVEAPRGKRMLFEPERKKLDGESGYDEVKIHDGSLSPEEIEARQLEGEIEKKMRATFGDEAIDSVSPLSLHAFRSSTEIPTRHLQSNGGTDEQLLTESDNPLDSESFPIPQEKFPMPSRPPPSRTIISGGHPGSPTQHQNQNRRKFQLRLVSLYNKH
ncbi:unnamed protein product, partial [Mesorhabditis belari]|uniref:Uncharacterized protein n=1 Tax=Mesorhabditis belari TaxID=2138241 RepID=A0AAF3FGI2_9BILA